MHTVTKRDLNQNTASVLERVTDSGDVVITERGEPRWRVSTYHAHDSSLARMERDGRYTPAPSAPAPWASRPNGPACTSAQVDALREEMRGDH